MRLLTPATSLICLFTLVLHPVGTAADDGPLPPEQAAATLQVPNNFKVTLFAGEPDIVQPIAMTTDAHGRLWVVECLSYPDWSSEPTGSDRVIILEDTDGDGRHDSRKVFLDNGRNLSGIELGFGGVWLCSTPELIFVPDRDHDDIPDGPPEVLLDGWDVTARHNVFNGLTWGPDGWLYGCNGILSNSLVGAPGTPESDRTRLNCGVWRYHPTRRIFELYASGTTNPWGLDFDDVGRMFITNCVIEHVFQVFPGGHYKRMFGQDLNPNVFGLIESCADHIHWGGGFWDISIGGVHNDFGGGHAHAGAMIYLGDNWPSEYYGNLFTVNIHGQRMNRDSFRKAGSGVEASHLSDFCLSRDPWFRGLEMVCGADGAVYLSDWNDVGECHDYEDVERDTGRIFKISYLTPDGPVNMGNRLTEGEDLTLLGVQHHPNQWFARHARLILQERAARDGRVDAETIGIARRMARNSGLEAAHQLEDVWTLHVTNNLDPDTMESLLKNENEIIRGWAVRLEVEDRTLTPERLNRFLELAQSDPSPVVLLELASALQRLPADGRFQIAGLLCARAESANDHNLPLMIWYGIEPLAGDSQGRDLELLRDGRIPLVSRYLARRIASLDGGIHRLTAWLATSAAISPERLEPILLGLRDAVEGRRGLETPESWAPLLSRADTLTPPARDAVQYLSLVFGDESAFAALTTLAADRGAPADDRRHALETLILVNDDRLVDLLLASLTDSDLASPALRGLSAYSDPAIAAAVIERYSRLTADQQQEAISTLAARRESAAALLDAIAAGSISSRDVSIYVARQIRDYNDQDFNARIEQLWGSVRATPEEKSQRISQFQAEFARDGDGDAAAGRTLFTQKCANCHKLFGEGAAIGPDLTGAQRSNTEYLLQHIVDPSSAVPAEYRVFTVLTADGRLLNGVVPEESTRTLTLQTPTERIVIDRGEIEELKPTSASMMPEGLLEQLTPEQRRDLFAYLQSTAPPK